jgi:hypothetical protein
MAEPIYSKLGMYIISFSMSICVSLLSLIGNGSVKCVPSFVVEQWLGKNVTAVTNTHATIVGRVVLDAVHVVSRKVGDYFFPEHLVSK